MPGRSHLFEFLDNSRISMVPDSASSKAESNLAAYQFNDIESQWSKETAAAGQFQDAVDKRYVVTDCDGTG